MRVLVLGGQGFVGSATVRQLVQTDWAEPVVASRSAGSRPTSDGVARISVDSCDEDALAQVLQGCDAVVNCVTGDGESIAQGAAALTRAAARAGRPVIVHLSTMSVYGTSQGRIRETAALRDDVGWYGHAKIEAEEHMQRYHRDGGRVVMLRPGCVIGPGSGPWVRRFANWLRRGRLADLGPQGDGPANLVDVEDVAQACVLALRHEPKEGALAVFNLAAPDSPRWNGYFTDLAMGVGAVPLQRWGARRLKLETYLLGVPLKVLERVAARTGLDVASRLPEGIPPSLLGLWSQQISLDVSQATSELGVQWTPYSVTLRQCLNWLNSREQRNA